MKTPKTKQDLENLIRDKIEESSELDYKDSRALNDAKEISKDVSAMANSAGGVIIYGIAEKNHFPQEITSINRDEFSKERLEQFITSNISPKIDQLKIIPIDVDGGVVYVVEIPQSTTAHQNTKDQRYYKRHNFKSEPMLDYEIRDVMNRAKYPLVELQFEIVVKREQYEIGDQDYLRSPNPKYELRDNYYLVCKPYNKGSNYTKYLNYFVELPKNILAEESKYLENISDEYSEFYGENTFRDVVDYHVSFPGKGFPKYGPSRFDPILPHTFGRSEKILLVSHLKLDDREIKWRVHADNAPVQTGSILLNTIPFKKNAN